MPRCGKAREARQRCYCRLPHSPYDLVRSQSLLSPSLRQPFKNLSFIIQRQNCQLSFFCIYTPFTLYMYARSLCTYQCYAPPPLWGKGKAWVRNLCYIWPEKRPLWWGICLSPVTKNKRESTESCLMRELCAGCDEWYCGVCEHLNSSREVDTYICSKCR